MMRRIFISLQRAGDNWGWLLALLLAAAAFWWAVASARLDLPLARDLTGTERRVMLPADPLDVTPLTICEQAQEVTVFRGLAGLLYTAEWRQSDGAIAVLRWTPERSPGIVSVSLNQQTAPLDIDQRTRACLEQRAAAAPGSLPE
jgi:hypothetical protein